MAPSLGERNSSFKTVKLLLEIDHVSHPAYAEVSLLMVYQSSWGISCLIEE